MKTKLKNSIGYLIQKRKPDNTGKYIEHGLVNSMGEAKEHLDAFTADTKDKVRREVDPKHEGVFRFFKGDYCLTAVRF